MAIYKIGAGAGNISISGMGSYKSGDTLDILPGSYGFFSFSGLSGITITASGGKVSFSSQMITSKNDGLIIDWSNLNYTGTGSIVGNNQTNNQNITHNNIDLTSSKASVFIDGTGSSVIYAGTPASTLYTNLIINNIKVGDKTSIFDGAYGGVLTLQNIIIGLIINNVTITNGGTGSPQKVRGNSVYGFNFNNWFINGTTLQNQNDIGIIQIVGWGTLANIQRNGGWGYLMRLITVDITGKGASVATNILDVNSTEYGTFDIRIDSDNTGTAGSFKITGTSWNHTHVSGGQKKDTIGYVTPILVLYGMTDAFGTNFPVSFDWCFGFNNIFSGTGNSNLWQQEFTAVPKIGANNISLTGDTSKYIDGNFAPIAGSPLVTPDGVIGYVPSGTPPAATTSTSSTSTSSSTKPTTTSTTTTSTTVAPTTTTTTSTTKANTTTSSSTTTSTSKHIVSVEVDYSDGTEVKL